jgi:inhibitor of KinA sporulation pathway (predicted exonuclease)
VSLINVVDVEGHLLGGATAAGTGPGMAQALELVGLPLEGRHHRGDDDSWNIAALVLHLYAKNAW